MYILLNDIKDIFHFIMCLLVLLQTNDVLSNVDKLLIVTMSTYMKCVFYNVFYNQFFLFLSQYSEQMQLLLEYKKRN